MFRPVFQQIVPQELGILQCIMSTRLKAIFHSSDFAGIGQLQITVTITSKSFLANGIHKSILLSPALVNMPFTDLEHQIKSYLQACS